MAKDTKKKINSKRAQSQSKSQPLVPTVADARSDIDEANDKNSVPQYRSQTIIAIAGVVIAALALIPSFGQWLSTRSSETPRSTMTPTNTMVTSTAIVATDTPIPPTETPDDIFIESYSNIIVETEGVIDIFIVPGSGNLTDFWMSVVFKNPYQATDSAPWDFGVSFRNNDNTSYTLVIDSTGGWVLRGWDAITDSNVDLASDNGAKGAKLYLGEKEKNQLFLSVSSDIGCFAINGKKVADLDLSNFTAPGRIQLVAGYWKGNSQPGKNTPFTDLTIHTRPVENCP